MIGILLKLEARYRRLRHQYRVNLLRSRFKKLGFGFRLGKDFKWSGDENCVLGNNCFFNHRAQVNGAGGLRVGDNVRFGPYAVIWTVDHDPYGDQLPNGQERIARPVEIGDNFWAGFWMMFTSGTSTGEGAIIGAGTVVPVQVPPLVIIVGQKWRQIRERKRDHYTHLAGHQ